MRLDVPRDARGVHFAIGRCLELAGLHPIENCLKRVARVSRLISESARIIARYKNDNIDLLLTVKWPTRVPSTQTLRRSEGSKNP